MARTFANSLVTRKKCVHAAAAGKPVETFSEDILKRIFLFVVVVKPANRTETEQVEMPWVWLAANKTGNQFHGYPRIH